ncbi:restriction endonuclease subunit S [Acinetobacter sp. SK-43]|uniref:restriction endonuclease subunit S n=1 Tax=Acinetobacter sp. SK-43 TaxID=2785295 RepID=UPI00188CE071|nr:restriction endonuclease subunit S [Acinetobacter sp. SK-43]MBF4457092.1 restriction endonuclease subunit S [Acinetobacter sp. SK-43]
MQFKQYPSYKNSGVEWLGDVPEDWEVIPSKFYFTERKEKAESSDKQLTASQKHGIIFQEDFMAENGRVMVVMKNPEILKKVRPNDFVISMRSFQGGLELSYLEGSISSAYVMLKPNLNVVDIEYFKYSFKTTRYIQSLQSTSNLIRDGQALRFNNFSQVKLVLPPKADQQKIVSFLDTETTRIDNLITKQEKLIELLEEQRKSIISHAVTKGLNPNAPMKDSGVEWLRDVPEHWMTPSSKHLLEIPITDGPHETPNFVDDGVPFISAEAISKGKIDFDKKRGYITPELNAIYSKKYSPKIEDIYMVKSGATTGKVAMVETTEEFNIWSPLAVFRCNKNKVLPKFLLAVFNSSHFYDALVLNWSYGTQQNIGMGVLSNIEIPCPPLKEQAEIIQHLDAQNTKFDKLISTQSQLIEKLKEYRSSIISHAVTGKIDVREFGA